jgi:hypothetical protein
MYFPIAAPKQLPFICSNADRIFMRIILAKPHYLIQYMTAAEACRPFKDHFRTGIDGKPVTYDKFYEDQLINFWIGCLRMSLRSMRLKNERTKISTLAISSCALSLQGKN